MSRETVLQELYSKLTEKKCFCDEDKHSFSEEIRNFFVDLSWLNQKPQQHVHAKRDFLLMKLSFLTVLFESRHCRWLQEIFQELAEDTTMLDSLVRTYHIIKLKTNSKLNLSYQHLLSLPNFPFICHTITFFA